VHLLNYWYPICFKKDVNDVVPYPFELWGEPMVAFRDEKGKPVCLQDRCPHRSVPLSIGKLFKGRLQCRYHGFTFDSTGKCVFLPSVTQDKIPASLCVVSYPIVEKEGMIWVWPGDASKAELTSGFPPEAPELHPATGDPRDGWVCFDQALEQDYSYFAFTENLLDPSHLQFTHEGTQGKFVGPTNKVVPEASQFELVETPEYKDGFQGHIKTDKTANPEDLLIIMYPPTLERIQITFPNGWKFHQNHYISPVSKNKTRVLIRSIRDWIKWMPDFIMWKNNPRVLRQDALVLMGQQQRLLQGSSRWNYPVKADALGVRYRQWWQNAEKSNPWFKSYSGSSFKKDGGIVRAHIDDIEDNHRCFDKAIDMCGGTESVSQKTIKQILSESPLLWPNELLKKGSAVSEEYFSFYNLTKQ
jgi:phenylpropionate dioxygenase-like ring-hydroxylating dioxygenase large terminal subunit